MTKKPRNVATEIGLGSDDESAPKSASRRGWKIAAFVAVLAAAVSMGVLASLLLAAGSSTPAKDVMACIPNRDFTKSDGAKGAHAASNCPPKGAPHEDGLVQDATTTGFDLVTIDGEKKTFAVRPADRPYIDVQHAQTHASLGQPIRIYTKRVEGEDVIIYMVDSPLKF